MRTSDDAVLRRVQEESVHQDCLPIHKLGVDDWAWRKGQEYGTILVNLDLHRVVDLPPDRLWARRNRSRSPIGFISS